MTVPGLETEINPDAVRERRFKRVRRGGYDPEQVRAYLAAVADSLETLQASAQRQTSSPIDPYTLLGERAAAVLRAADGQARAMQQEAERRAHRQIDDAARRAAKILAESQSESARIRRRSERLIEEVRDGAKEILAGEEQVRTDLRAVREAVLRALGRLEATGALRVAAPSPRDEEDDESTPVDLLFGLSDERQLDNGDLIDLPQDLLGEE